MGSDRARPAEGAQPAGDVKIETADVAETTVELVPLNESDATRQAIEKANVTARRRCDRRARGRTRLVDHDRPAGASAPRVSVRITCPNGSDLECDTASADIRVAARPGADPHRVRRPPARPGRGAFEAKSASGDIQVEHVEGRAAVNTVSGDVGVRTAMNGLAVNSSRAVVGEVYGDLTAGTVSGDLIVRAAGPARSA